MHGKASAEVIDVLQLKDEKQLVRDTVYYLFLNETQDWYYIIGGGNQGLFTMSDQDLVSDNPFNLSFINEGKLSLTQFKTTLNKK